MSYQICYPLKNPTQTWFPFYFTQFPKLANVQTSNFEPLRIFSRKRSRWDKEVKKDETTSSELDSNPVETFVVTVHVEANLDFEVYYDKKYTVLDDHLMCIKYVIEKHVEEVKLYFS